MIVTMNGIFKWAEFDNIKILRISEEIVYFDSSLVRSWKGMKGLTHVFIGINTAILNSTIICTFLSSWGVLLIPSMLEKIFNCRFMNFPVCSCTLRYFGLVFRTATRCHGIQCRISVRSSRMHQSVIKKVCRIVTRGANCTITP